MDTPTMKTVPTPLIITNKFEQRENADGVWVNKLDADKKKFRGSAILIKTNDVNYVFPKTLPIAKIDAIAEHKASNNEPFVSYDKSKGDISHYRLTSQSKLPSRINTYTNTEEPPCVLCNYYPMYLRETSDCFVDLLN